MSDVKELVEELRTAACRRATAAANWGRQAYGEWGISPGTAEAAAHHALIAIRYRAAADLLEQQADKLEWAAQVSKAFQERADSQAPDQVELRRLLEQQAQTIAVLHMLLQDFDAVTDPEEHPDLKGRVDAYLNDCEDAGCKAWHAMERAVVEAENKAEQQAETIRRLREGLERMNSLPG